MANCFWFYSLMGERSTWQVTMGSLGFLTIFLIFLHPWDPWICIHSVCWKWNLKQIEAIPPSVLGTKNIIFESFDLKLYNWYCHSKCNSLVPTNNTPIQFTVRYAHVWIWLHMYKHTCLECTWGSWKRRLGKKRGPAFCVMTEQTLLTFKSSCTMQQCKKMGKIVAF